MFFWICFPFLVSLLIFVINYHWNRRKLYLASLKYDGPAALPFIGNAFEFYCNNEDILERLYTIFSRYCKKPFRFWLGPQLVISFSNSTHVEKILSSTKLSYKHEVYDILKIVLGEGLITASGRGYKMHKKVIQPMFNLKYCKDSLTTYQKHLSICMQEFDKLVGKDFFDVNHVIHSCTIDILGEIILGYNINAQKHENEDYMQALADVYDLSFARIVKPWLYSDTIYNFTEHKVKFDNVIELLDSFMNQVVVNSWTRRKLFKEAAKEGRIVPVIDQIVDHMEQNPALMTNKDLVSHLLSLFAASEDTTAIISSFVCLCFGMYPEYQERAAREIYEVFGAEPCPPTYDDLSKLTYLDMCVKEALRLAPIGPYIMRQPLEDLYIDSHFIPKKSAVIVPIFNMHRNPEFWENPFHFHPDHFTPEAVKSRPLYIYLPFSAGARGCIGKILANMGLKMILCTILQRYEIEAVGKFPDVKLKMDISVRPVNGYNIRVKKRVWNKNMD